MASTLCRIAGAAIRRTTYLTSVRSMGGSINVGAGLEKQHEGKIEIDGEIPDAAGHAVGPERFEIMSLKMQHDPWEFGVRSMGVGTYDKPNLVPAVSDRRIIGCICEDDSTAIVWMWLYKGEPRRCMCGHWFELQEINQEDFPQAVNRSAQQ